MIDNRSSHFALAFAVILILGLALPVFAQGNGSLRVRVTPGVAGVFVDGDYYGTAAEFKSTGSMLSLPAGEHKVRIVDPRYQPLETTVTIESGKTEVIRRALKPKALASPPFGQLKIKNGNRAAVYLNNQYYGQADEFNGPGQALLLPPGEYNLRLVPKGGSAREEKVSITAKKTTTITM